MNQLAVVSLSLLDFFENFACGMLVVNGRPGFVRRDTNGMFRAVVSAQQHERYSGLVHHRHRHLASFVLGRLQSDSRDCEGGIRGYAFLLNDSLNRSDWVIG